MPKYPKAKPFDIIRDILQMQKDIKALQLNTNAIATAPSSNTLTLLDGAAPATPVGSTVLFSESGNLGYVGADGNTYDTGRLRATVLTAQPITTTTPITALSGIAVGIGQYSIRGIIEFTGTAGGTPTTFTFTGPSTGNPTRVFTNFMQTGTGGTVNPNNFGAFGAISSPSYGTTTAYYYFDGNITFTVAGLFGISASISSGTVTIATGSYFDLMPIR